MTGTGHSAAMALFRLVGAGVEFQLHRRGVDLVMPAEMPQDLAEAAAPHADAIGELLRLRVAEEGS